MITLDEAKEILAKEYHIDNYTYLVKELLLPDFKSDKHIVSYSGDIFTSVTQLGDSSDCELCVFEVLLKEGVQNRRVAITQEMFKVLRGLRINNAIVAFANADNNNYRISLLTSKYEYDGEKIVKVLSNPRRYSYSLGLGTKTKTAYKFLIAKGKVKNLDELLSRFSVEVVNKQFYSEIATSFTQLVGGERDGKTYEKLLTLHGVTDHNKYAEFGVRLIGRIMFCWFLREKRSENDIPLVPDDMLALETVESKANYYHDILEPLFFELLNTNQKRRKKCFDTDYYRLIPYLNGGLFSPHIDDMYKFNEVTSSGQYGVVTIPNEWFSKLYLILSQYNFTVDENTAYDIELSIDPEMLGRIFENLLAEINPETGENAKKSTGSFYTPRDIVDYMVDSSLCEYLKTKTDIDEVKLNALISYSKDDDDLAVFDDTEKKKLIEALYTVTVLDPACGSGAFPIGMLQKIVYILQELDPEANLWFDEIVKGAPIYVRKAFEEKFSNGELDYIRKLTVIEKSIYGIDIQPIAVEISRLRCFLSLIIEETVFDTEDNRNIKPLPNLDFKFIIANSLISLDDSAQLTLFEDQNHISLLKKIREEYFNADSERRTELKLEFKDVQQDMLVNTINNYQKIASARYQQLSEWKPFENQATSWFDPEWMFGIKDGFDIVIGNPPYLESRHPNFSDSLKSKLQEQLHERYGKKFDLIPRGSDLLIYFYELSLRLIKQNGINVFITQNSWLDTEYGSQFQKYLQNTTNIISIIDSDFKSFESANINTIITIFQGKTGCSKDIVFARFHVKYGDYRLTQSEINNRTSLSASIKIFSPQNELIKSYKWGFLFNSDTELLELLNHLNHVGKKEAAMPWLAVGQGLNITNDYANSKYSLPNDINDSELICYLNVDENGYYVWDHCETYLLSNKEMSDERVESLSNDGYVIFDEKHCKRSRPSLILPRGIGNKHFCSINKNNGYSASCVDIYITKPEKIKSIWLFMNTTLFWMLREISGRKSLGGGMLKAEAIDLKQFPLYFEFNNSKMIDELINQAKGKKVLCAIDEIETDLHKQIDELFYEELNIPLNMQEYIKTKFIEVFNARTQKSTT